MVDADDDGRKDLLLGQAAGTVRLYLNINTDADPQFDGGSLLQVGEPGSKTNIAVGARATSTTIDWDNDGKRDLVVGALDGKVRIYINEGTNPAPDYRTVQYAQENGGDLIVPTQRSSPEILDLNGDGTKDLLLGNTEGQLLLYDNVGTDEAPSFSGYTPVEADSVPIDLAGYARSRPFVCDWNDDGFLDVLIGSGDGRVRLYLGIDVYTAITDDRLPIPANTVRLATPYPNPFNPETYIRFELGHETALRLIVYDATGRQIRTLIDREMPVGPHMIPWNGRDDVGEEVSSGVYFVRLWTAKTIETTKVTLIR